jgi:hypothetical protein
MDAVGRAGEVVWCTGTTIATMEEAVIWMETVSRTASRVVDSLNQIAIQWCLGDERSVQYRADGTAPQWRRYVCTRTHGDTTCHDLLWIVSSTLPSRDSRLSERKGGRVKPRLTSVVDSVAVVVCCACCVRFSGSIGGSQCLLGSRGGYQCGYMRSE